MNKMLTVCDCLGTQFFAARLDVNEKLPPAVKLTDTNGSMEHGIDSPFHVTIVNEVLSEGVMVPSPVVQKMFGDEWVIYDDGYQPVRVLTDNNFLVEYFEI